MLSHKGFSVKSRPVQQSISTEELKLWATCSWRQMAGTESILWTKGTKLASGTTLSRKFTLQALLHRPPWLLPCLARRVWGKKLMVSAGQGPYLNHSNCYSWWKYPWTEVAQNTLFLKQEPPERGENLQWFTWRWDSENYHSQVQLYRCDTDQSVFTIRKFWVLCELWVVSLDRPEPGHTPVKQAEETNRFNFHFFNTQLG